MVNSVAYAGYAGDRGLIPGSRFLRRKWQTTSVFLPENPMDRAWFFLQCIHTLEERT